MKANSSSQYGKWIRDAGAGDRVEVRTRRIRRWPIRRAERCSIGGLRAKIPGNAGREWKDRLELRASQGIRDRTLRPPGEVPAGQSVRLPAEERPCRLRSGEADRFPRRAQFCEKMVWGVG